MLGTKCLSLCRDALRRVPGPGGAGPYRAVENRALTPGVRRPLSIKVAAPFIKGGPTKFDGMGARPNEVPVGGALDIHPFELRSHRTLRYVA